MGGNKKGRERKRKNIATGMTMSSPVEDIM